MGREPQAQNSVGFNAPQLARVMVRVKRTHHAIARLTDVKDFLTA
jgi:hypothetical protein